ncbi:MAG: hypothetical protein IKK75_05300 [Clostridia bacterium]|nr:hypothetical protein [Clostridia bacterium]
MKKRMIVFLAMLLLAFSACAEEDEFVEVVLFDGEASVTGNWQLAVGVNTTNAGGSFDPSLITADGWFTVEYTGSVKAVYLALSDWQTETWASVNVPFSCETSGGLCTVTFTYQQCYIQYGSKDFSAIDQICAGSTTAAGGTTIRRIVWHGRPLRDDLGATAILFSGAATANAANANLHYLFTQHVGGDFDAAQINPGSRFYVEFTGPQNGLYIAFASHSGATQWSRVNPEKVEALENGRWAAWFSYDDVVRAWGSNFARLDQLSVYTTTNTPVTLHRIAYFAGQGEPTDASDGRWIRPDTGIALIGDSICQNPIYMYGDWNTILGRSDCVNFGIGAQTTVECRTRIGELASRDYSMVIFIVGINDIGRGYTKEEIVANIDAMINEIRTANPECQFLLMSVLPTTEAFYAGQQAKINLLNIAYKRYASQHEGVTFVNAYARFTRKTGEYAYPELLSDGLHPNAEGYAVIAEVLRPYLPEE